MAVLAVRVIIRDGLAASYSSVLGREIVDRIHDINGSRFTAAIIHYYHETSMFYFQLFRRSSGTPASKCFRGTKWLRGGPRALSLGVTPTL